MQINGRNQFNCSQGKVQDLSRLQLVLQSVGAMGAM